MRLLNVHTREFQEFWAEETPPYAIASHRWGTDEPTWKTFESHQFRGTSGYQKVEGFCDHVKTTKSLEPPVDWLWIDTCCIDKTNSVELSEAINSMFNWYRNARACFVYLEDVKHNDDLAKIGESAWFSRGWTLQELLAPKFVEFLSRDWLAIGYRSDEPKSSGLPLCIEQLTTITGVPKDVLRDFQSCSQLPIETKLAWMTHRQTTRPEDRYYSLLGIFGVFMVPIYGEGAENANRRLMHEIKLRHDHDISIQAQPKDQLRPQKGLIGRTPWENLPRMPDPPPHTPEMINVMGTDIPASDFLYSNSRGDFIVIREQNKPCHYVQVYKNGSSGDWVECEPSFWRSFKQTEAERKSRDLMKWRWESCGKPTLQYCPI